MSLAELEGDVVILTCAISANLYAISLPDGRGDAFPYTGAAVIGVIAGVMPAIRAARLNILAAIAHE